MSIKPSSSLRRVLSLVLALTMVFGLVIPTSASAAGNAVQIEVGESTRLRMPGLYFRTSWTSSDEAVATVSGSGTVTGVAPGTATVTATGKSILSLIWGKEATTVTFQVTVVEAQEPEESTPAKPVKPGWPSWWPTWPSWPSKPTEPTEPEETTVPTEPEVTEPEPTEPEPTEPEPTVPDETDPSDPSDPSTPDEPDPSDPSVPDPSDPTDEPTEPEPTEPEPDLSYEGYSQVWADEFEAAELNREDWNVELHNPGWVNEELQEYVDSEENIYIEDGNLVLKPVKTENEDGSVSYTSGRVNTQGKHDFTYGLFEARLKVPTGMGYLPAFWLMASDENLYGQWPRCGEIDIMEIMGQSTDTNHGTIHYGNPHAQSQGTYELEEGNFSDEYHTFALEWEPGRIRWYVDGILYHEETEWYSTTEGQGTITYPAPFDQPFYVILNLAIGGSWVGYPDETTTFEDQQYTIDYVRVYQKDSYDENVKAPEKEDVVIREPDATGNYVVNGDFAVAEALNDTADWIFLTAEGGEGSAQIASEQMDITMTAAGNQTYSIQLVQPNIPIEKGGTYKLTFEAYADEARTAVVDVTGLDARSWTRYMKDTTITVGPDKQTYTFEFTMTEETDAQARLEFNLGNQGSTAGFHLDNVRLEKTGQTEIVEEKTARADGNHVYNGSFQEGEGRMAYWTVAPEGADVSVTNENNIRKLKIVAGDDVSEENPIVVYQEELPLAANSNYAISYSVEGPAGNTLKMEVAGVSFDAALDGAEQTVTGSFVTGATFDNTIKFTVTQPGTYYIDDVRVVEDSLIKNGSFNAGLSGYEPYVDSSASATYTVDSLSEDNAFDITINDTGDQDWKIQLKQNNVNLVQGQWYRLTLDMKSSMDRQIMVALQRDGSKYNDDWTPYCQQAFDVTGDYQTYTIEFQMNPGTAPYSDPESVLSISMGSVGGTQITTQHRICIDNISLEKIDEPAAPIEPKPAGVELIENGDFESGETGWGTLNVIAPATGSISLADGKATVDITNVGDADWNVQMIHYGIQLDQGATYELSFTGSSTVEREIAVNLMSSTYAWYGGFSPVLTSEEQTFTMTFTMGAETNVDAGLFISMGYIDDTTPASTITLDNFSLKKTSGEEPVLPETPAADNLIVNGDFSDGTNGWGTMSVASPAEGTLTVQDGKLLAEITNPGTADWNVQMIQSGLNLEQGSTYTLSFAASSTVERTIKVCLMSTDGNYNWYGEIVPTLTADEQTFSADITMDKATDTNAGLYVSMGMMADGTTPASTITLDNFVLTKVVEEETPADPVEPKPVGEELLANGDFSEGDAGWTLNGGGNNISVADGKIVADITNPGANEWDVQMIHYGIQLEQGCSYKLTFTASSTVDRVIKVVLMSDSYVWYGGQNAVALTADAQTFTIEFTMNEATNTNAGIFISMGKMENEETPASVITLDDFSLVKVS